MGATVSKIRGALITRPLQRFNIDARTEKLLAKEQPKRAPRFEQDEQLLDRIRQENLQVTEAEIEKDGDHHKRLEEVFVASTDPEEFNPDINRTRPLNPSRPLPR